MNLSRPAIALYMALVFVSGAVLGVFGDRVYSATTIAKSKSAPKRTAEEFRKDYLKFMKTRLNLTDDQITKLGLILDETRAKMDELHRSTIPEQMALRKAQSENIRAMLKPEQQTEYDKMLREREETMKKNNGRSGPGF